MDLSLQSVVDYSRNLCSRSLGYSQTYLTLATTSQPADASRSVQTILVTNKQQGKCQLTKISPKGLLPKNDTGLLTICSALFLKLSPRLVRPLAFSIIPLSIEVITGATSTAAAAAATASAPHRNPKFCVFHAADSVASCSTDIFGKDLVNGPLRTSSFGRGTATATGTGSGTGNGGEVNDSLFVDICFTGIGLSSSPMAALSRSRQGVPDPACKYLLSSCNCTVYAGRLHSLQS